MLGRRSAGKKQVVVKRQGPSLMGTVARTAAITGTATATSRMVGNAMDGSAQRKQEKSAEAAFQAQQAQVELVPAPAAAPPATNDLLTQLQQLAQLKESGLLTDEEFQLAKAKLLGS